MLHFPLRPPSPASPAVFPAEKAFHNPLSPSLHHRYIQMPEDTDSRKGFPCHPPPRNHRAHLPLPVLIQNTAHLPVPPELYVHPETAAAAWNSIRGFSCPPDTPFVPHSKYCYKRKFPDNPEQWSYFLLRSISCPYQSGKNPPVLPAPPWETLHKTKMPPHNPEIHRPDPHIYHCKSCIRQPQRKHRLQPAALP